jgi:hypothetical protein
MSFTLGILIGMALATLFIVTLEGLYQTFTKATRNLNPPAERLAWASEVVEALAFYADPDTWFAVGLFPDPPNGPIMDDFSEWDGRQRPGDRARTALQWEET